MIERKDIFIDGAWIPSTASDVLTVADQQTTSTGRSTNETANFPEGDGTDPRVAGDARPRAGRPQHPHDRSAAGRNSNDSATRVISAALSPLLGQTIVVDNRAGGAGLIGTMDVVRATPDGLTLMCGSLSPLAANVAFVKNLPYDPRRDLTPIAGATLTNHVLVVAPNSPIRTFADFIAYAKQRPGQVTIGYSTAIVQLQIATLNKLAGIELMPVPYRERRPRSRTSWPAC